MGQHPTPGSRNQDASGTQDRIPERNRSGSRGTGAEPEKNLRSQRNRNGTRDPPRTRGTGAKPYGLVEPERNQERTRTEPGVPRSDSKKQLMLSRISAEYQRIFTPPLPVCVHLSHTCHPSEENHVYAHSAFPLTAIFESVQLISSLVQVQADIRSTINT